MNPLALEVGGQIAGTAMGMATAGWNDRRQLKQQRKLNDLEMEGQAKMSKFNQQLALDMWEKTNYEAQRKQLEKAGLNPGLLYGQGGGGGATASTPTGHITGGEAPKGGGELGMGMQIGLQAAAMKAQIELTQAQTQKTRVETTKTGGVDTQETQARTGLIATQMQTEAGKQAIMQWEQKLKEIEANINTTTQENIIDNVKQANLKLIAEVETEGNKARESRETVEQKIHQINTASVEQALRIAAQKAGLIKTGAETRQVNETIRRTITDRIQSWSKLSQTDRELDIKKALQELHTKETEFNVSTPQEIKQWTQIITDVIRTIKY